MGIRGWEDDQIRCLLNLFVPGVEEKDGVFVKLLMLVRKPFTEWKHRFEFIEMF